jgi:hypothetical protein
MLAVLVAGVAALCVAIAATPVGQEWWTSVQPSLRDLLDWFQGLFS